MTAKPKRQDAYIVRLTVAIPLNLSDPTSYSKAVEAVAQIGVHIPTATVEVVSASLGKMTAAVNTAPQSSVVTEARQEESASPRETEAGGEITEPDAHRAGGLKPESGMAAANEQARASSKASCTHDAGEVHGRRSEPTSPPISDIPVFLDRRVKPPPEPAVN